MHIPQFSTNYPQENLSTLRRLWTTYPHFVVFFGGKPLKMSTFLSLLHKLIECYPQSAIFIGGQPPFVHIPPKKTIFFIHLECINGFILQKNPFFDKEKGNTYPQ